MTGDEGRTKLVTIEEVKDVELEKYRKSSDEDHQQEEDRDGDERKN